MWDCVAADLGVVVADPIRLSDQPRHIGVSDVGDDDGAAGSAVDEFERFQQRGVAGSRWQTRLPFFPVPPPRRTRLPWTRTCAWAMCRSGACLCSATCRVRCRWWRAIWATRDTGCAGVSAEHCSGWGNGPVCRVSFGLSVSHVQWKLDARGGQHRVAAAVAQRAAGGCDVRLFKVAG